MMDSLRVKRLEDAVLELTQVISELSLDTYDFRRLDCVEACELCGIAQPLIWTADDELWKEVTGIQDGSGIYCPQCFDKLAQEISVLLQWKPTKHDPPQP